jgi:transcriptional regulator with XRE-family HTH domain
MNRPAIRTVVAANITSLMADDESTNDQTKLAEKAGIPSRTLASILNKTLSAKVETLSAIARALNVTASNLMTIKFKRDPFWQYQERIAALPAEYQALIHARIAIMMDEAGVKVSR